MFRKSLFLGLTLMLGVVLISLIVQGRRQEKKQAAMRVAEVIKQYKPTATRIIAPRDLEIVSAEVISNSVKPPPGCFAVIRNHGHIAYSNAQLELAAVGKDGHVFATGAFVVEKVIPPGAEVHVENAVAEPVLKSVDEEIKQQRLKAGAIHQYRLRVRSAEIAAASAPLDTAQK